MNGNDMKKNIMRKNLWQSIRSSLGRYIAIVAIIALGAGMFVGLRTTKSDMVATGQQFMDGQNMFDLRLLNDYGWSDTELDAIKQIDSVVHAEGAVSMDIIAYTDDASDESVYKLHQIPETVNKVYLLGGRMPQAPDECLADGFHATDAILGTKIRISDNNDEKTLESINDRSYTIVGYVSTPLYMDMSRGITTLGNGSVKGYLYLPKEAFATDYYTEINVTLAGDYSIYTDAYHDAMADASSKFEEILLPLAQDRYKILLRDAKEEYADGLAAYEDGLEEFNKSKAEALLELDKAKQDLDQAQAEIDANRVKAEDTLETLNDGQKEIDNNRALLNESVAELAKTKADTFSQLADANAELLANYKEVKNNLKQVNDGITQIDNGIIQLDNGITQLESGLQQIDTMLSLMDTLLPLADSAITRAEKALAQAEQIGADADTLAQLREELNSIKERRDGYLAQHQDLKNNKETLSVQLEQLKGQRADLQAQRSVLIDNQAPLEAALVTIDEGFLELESNQLQAENQFAAAEAKIRSGEIEIEAAQQKLDQGMKEVNDGLRALEEGQAELDSGKEEYEKGRAEALQKIEDGEKELNDAKSKLDDAKESIDDMQSPDVYALDRTTNVGYLALDNNSDIVEGVSTVFPAFFLLIAALVCITTMTRMVEEERTQIGTLKAMGYSSGAIISKYLLYAGSAAIIGCGFGVLAGSVVFPWILWQAYRIILLLTPDILLRINWPLCLSVVAVYTVVTLAVTWYCCRMALREQPAELIRPKAPTTGKKIFLEFLPFWEKFKFLDKVMLRNIFRYKQRLLMMLVGIGGCTALLLTGFGIRDSIVDIVSYQFDEITLYDMEIRFSDGLSTDDMRNFSEGADDYAKDIAYYHQSSVEASFGEVTKDITLVAASSDITRFMDIHTGKNDLAFPKVNEALISIGAAENMGLSVGDTIMVRDSEMNTLSLTISGIYDNNVYNYIIVDMESLLTQYDEMPKLQMACLTLKEGVDAHEAASHISELSGVMNITITEDLADQVGSMMDALDLVVATVIVCAGLLAVIVIYNLTNINITERLREIATIKVLGFNSAETAAYVFKENLFLSVMGACCGLFGGIWLLEFVMSKIRIDMVWLEARALPVSFVLAALLTLLAACFVDFLLYFKLEKINMAEALKSVE